MKPGFKLNPSEEFVEYIKKTVKDNSGYCIYAKKGDKKNKCPKYCKKLPNCPCGMFVKCTSIIIDEFANNDDT